jgi:hypothetical protein
VELRHFVRIGGALDVLGCRSMGFKGEFRQWEHWLLDRRTIAATSFGRKIQLARNAKERRNIERE